MPSGAEPTTATAPPHADGSPSGDAESPVRAERIAMSTGRKIAAIAFLVVVVLGAAAAALTRSALFHAKTIRVHGDAHVSRGEVLRIAAITSSTNVFTLDTAAAERRFEREPWIADVTVTKDLPSTVVVEVHERVAVGVAESAGVLRLVADDGVLLDEARPRMAAGLTRIVPAYDGAAEPSIESIGGAARAIAAMTPAVRHRVSVVSILADGQLRVDLSSGAQVAYGPPVEPVEKAQVLGALLDWAAAQGASIAAADIRIPSVPTVEFVGGGGYDATVR